MDEEVMAIYCTVRDEIYKALGTDVEIELMVPPRYRGKKRGASNKISAGIDFYLFEGGHSDEENNI